MFKNNIKGVYTYNHLDIKRLRYFYDLLQKTLEQHNYVPYYFPAFGLWSNLEKEKNHFNFKGETFKVDNYFLRPTSEAIAYPIVYEDQSIRYPFKWYQCAPVYRNETKQNRKYFRSRQIAFFHETHAIFSNKRDCLIDLKFLMKLTIRFLRRIGILCKIHKRPEEDKFPGAVSTYAFDTILPDKTVIQVATLHYLGDNFSKVYKSGNPTYGLCLGFSERIIGVLKQLYQDKYRYIHNPYAILGFKSYDIKTPKHLKPINFINIKDFNIREFYKYEEMYDNLYSVKIKSSQDLENLVFLDTSTKQLYHDLSIVQNNIKQRQKQLMQSVMQRQKQLLLDLNDPILGVSINYKS
jgi:seryl-tRNA synthetase